MQVAGIFEKFTEKAIKAVMLAQNFAQKMGASEVSTPVQPCSYKACTALYNVQDAHPPLLGILCTQSTESYRHHSKRSVCCRRLLNISSLACYQRSLPPRYVCYERLTEERIVCLCLPWQKAVCMHPSCLLL